MISQADIIIVIKDNNPVIFYSIKRPKYKAENFKEDFSMENNNTNPATETKEVLKITLKKPASFDAVGDIKITT